MKKDILARLAEGPVLGDGGYLLELEKRGWVQAGPFTPEVCIRHPEAVAELHREFLRAGAEVLTTLTFYASDDKLATVGMQADLVLFDPGTVLDRATPQDPHALSVGIRTVWVNGEIVYEDGRATGRLPGRVIRRSGAAERPSAWKQEEARGIRRGTRSAGARDLATLGTHLAREEER